MLSLRDFLSENRGPLLDLCCGPSVGFEPQDKSTLPDMKVSGLEPAIGQMSVVRNVEIVDAKGALAPGAHHLPAILELSVDD